MKKTIISVALAVMVIAGYALSAHADSFNATVPLSFNVPEQFGFLLDQYAHDFGTINTGEGAETTITAGCFSNHGIPWKLKVQAANFENEVGDVFPSDYGGAYDPTPGASNVGFSMAVWGPASGDPNELQGTINYPAGWVPSASAFDVYTSTAGEGADDYVPVTMGLYISLPGALPSGLYTTDFVITMYE